MENRVRNPANPAPTKHPSDAPYPAQAAQLDAAPGRQRYPALSTAPARCLMCQLDTESIQLIFF